MINFAVFATEAQAYARLQIENNRVTQERGIPTIYSELIIHPTDGSAIFNIDDHFDITGIDIREYEECINLGYFPDLTNPHDKDLEKAKIEYQKELVSAAKYWQEYSVLSTGVSAINSLLDLSIIYSRIVGDGTKINIPCLQCTSWLSLLWGDWATRRVAVNNATTIQEVQSISLDFSMHGEMPHDIGIIKYLQMQLISEIVNDTPNVPQEVHDILGDLSVMMHNLNVGN